MPKSFRFSLLGALTLLLVLALAPAISWAGVSAAPVSITQSVDPVTITALNSISCNAGGLHADNSYYRAFDLARLC